MTRPKILFGLSGALAIPVLLAACSTGGGSTAVPTIPPATPAPSVQPAVGIPEACPKAQPDPLPAGETRTVTIVTGQGTIVIKVEADLSPIAAGNFVALADCGYYDGVVFHRVVRDFVIQGGDGQFGRSPGVVANRIGTGGPGYEIQDEPVTATYARGTVAMARSSAPNSVGSQFFVVLDDRAAEALADPRANNYQIVGAVTGGMETADAIEAAAAGVEIPADPVVMTDVTVANP